jgi:NTE family protein
VGVCNLGTGAFRAVDEQASRIQDWVYASCAMPVFFDPLETTDAGGVKEQWVDGGVRDVTPLGTALDLGAGAVLVIRASPRPKPGAVRTFSDLIKIGLRAVDILQSEVSANDTATADLINDLIAARAAQAQALTGAGIGPAQAALILKPFDDQIAKYHFAPIHVIEPDREFSETLEFDPAKIRTAIAAGRKAASDHFAAIQALIA